MDDIAAGLGDDERLADRTASLGNDPLNGQIPRKRHPDDAFFQNRVVEDQPVLTRRLGRAGNTAEKKSLGKRLVDAVHKALDVDAERVAV